MTRMNVQPASTVKEAREQLKKLQKQNREKEITHVMYRSIADGNVLNHLDMKDINDLGKVIDQHLKEINTRIDALKEA